MPHTGKKKAKTKKQLKKAVNRLYNALMKEKDSHRKASKMVGQLKQALNSSANTMKYLAKNNLEHMRANSKMENNNEHTLDVSAALIKRVAQG